jgi:hypothetical protein
VTASRITELKEISELYEMPESMVLKKNMLMNNHPTASRRRINWNQLKKLLEPCGFVFI